MTATLIHITGEEAKMAEKTGVEDSQDERRIKHLYEEDIYTEGVTFHYNPGERAYSVYLSNPRDTFNDDHFSDSNVDPPRVFEIPERKIKNLTASNISPEELVDRLKKFFPRIYSEIGRFQLTYEHILAAFLRLRIRRLEDGLE